MVSKLKDKISNESVDQDELQLIDEMDEEWSGKWKSIVHNNKEERSTKYNVFLVFICPVLVALWAVGWALFSTRGKESKKKC